MGGWVGTISPDATPPSPPSPPSPPQHPHSLTAAAAVGVALPARALLLSRVVEAHRRHTYALPKRHQPRGTAVISCHGAGTSRLELAIHRQPRPTFVSCTGLHCLLLEACQIQPVKILGRGGRRRGLGGVEEEGGGDGGLRGARGGWGVSVGIGERGRRACRVPVPRTRCRWHRHVTCFTPFQTCCQTRAHEGRCCWKLFSGRVDGGREGGGGEAGGGRVCVSHAQGVARERVSQRESEPHKARTHAVKPTRVHAVTRCHSLPTLPPPRTLTAHKLHEQGVEPGSQWGCAARHAFHAAGGACKRGEGVAGGGARVWAGERGHG